MKQFARECEHARLEREQKRVYEADETADGCWKCGGPLEPFTFGHVTLSAEEAADPESEARFREWLARPRFECPRCMREWLERSVANAERAGYASHKEVMRRLRSPEGRAERRRRWRETIAGVEACGPDCPWWGRLLQLRRALEEDEANA